MVKRKRQHLIKNNDWKIGNSRSMRLLTSGVFKKLWFWTFLVVRFNIDVERMTLKFEEQLDQRKGRSTQGTVHGLYGYPCNLSGYPRNHGLFRAEVVYSFKTAF